MWVHNSFPRACDFFLSYVCAILLFKGIFFASHHRPTNSTAPKCMYVCAVIVLMVKEAKISGLSNMLSHDVLYNWSWPGAWSVLAISCGYFAYDQWDMIRKHLYSPKAPHLLVHHAVLLTCFSPALQRDLCVNYLILTLLCEVRITLIELVT